MRTLSSHLDSIHSSPPSPPRLSPLPPAGNCFLFPPSFLFVSVPPVSKQKQSIQASSFSSGVRTAHLTPPPPHHHHHHHPVSLPPPPSCSLPFSSPAPDLIDVCLSHRAQQRPSALDPTHPSSLQLHPPPQKKNNNKNSYNCKGPLLRSVGLCLRFFFFFYSLSLSRSLTLLRKLVISFHCFFFFFQKSVVFFELSCVSFALICQGCVPFPPPSATTPHPTLCPANSPPTQNKRVQTHAPPPCDTHTPPFPTACRQSVVWTCTNGWSFTTTRQVRAPPPPHPPLCYPLPSPVLCPRARQMPHMCFPPRTASFDTGVAVLSHTLCDTSCFRCLLAIT